MMKNLVLINSVSSAIGSFDNITTCLPTCIVPLNNSLTLVFMFMKAFARAAKRTI